jgi:hypothetical protein
MHKFNTVWIRDGVLVNRMHINPVAFAYTTWMFSSIETRQEFSIEKLINYGFEKSGYSCLDKLSLFNADHAKAVEDVLLASGFYDEMVSGAAARCEFFPGAQELLADLHAANGGAYITSAIGQDTLHLWARGQGAHIMRYINEILGRRDNFLKGRDHFEHIARSSPKKCIYYVADAPSEIETGATLSAEFNIIPIGFGYHITTEQVMAAGESVKTAIADVIGRHKTVRHTPFDSLPQIELELLSLPDSSEIVAALWHAGASHVAFGEFNDIFANLRKIFVDLKVLRV